MPTVAVKTLNSQEISMSVVGMKSIASQEQPMPTVTIKAVTQKHVAITVKTAQTQKEPPPCSATKKWTK